jgi:hypothetical protein
MKALICSLIFGAALLASGSSSAAGPANANVTSYTATCAGLGTATSVRLEPAFENNSTGSAGVAFHVVGTNQIVLFAGPAGLLAQSEAAGTSCIVTAINGEAVEPFFAPIVILNGTG